MYQTCFNAFVLIWLKLRNYKSYTNTQIKRLQSSFYVAFTKFKCCTGLMTQLYKGVLILIRCENLFNLHNFPLVIPRTRVFLL